MSKFVLPLCGILAISPLFAQIVLFTEGDAVFFFRGVSDPPADWTSAEFDPAAAGWEFGSTGIGYGDGDDATVLDDMQNGYAAVFLWTEIDVPDDLNGSVWELRVRYDDGFVAYLDGQEVARRGLVGVPPAIDELSELHEISQVDGFDETILLGDSPSSAFVLSPGTHALAVQVHNASLDSSDLSFAAELVARPFAVTGINPAFGPTEGGNEVTISGVGFPVAETPVVRFGSNGSDEVEVLSSATLRVVVPAASTPGIVDVSVETARGQAILPRGYRYSGTGPGQSGLEFSPPLLATQFASVDGPEISERGTFEVWVRRNGDLFDFFRVLLSASGGGDDLLRFELHGSAIRLRTREDGGEWASITAAVPMGADTWHHLACSFSPTGRRLFFDGALAASDSQPARLPAFPQFRLGAGFSGGIPLNSAVESLRLWAVDRSEREIQRDRFRSLTEGVGLEGSWTLVEGAGQIAGDSGPGGFPLVLGQSEADEETDPAWIEVTDFPRFAIGGIDPDSGSREGGDPITIFGTGFSLGDPAVLFGGMLAPSVEVVDPWTLVAITPPSEVHRTVDVEVRVAGNSATLTNAFSYQPLEVYAFVREGDLWDYWPGRTAPDSDWSVPEFDPVAAGWQRGPTGIGYGDDDDATILPDMEGQYVTLYARTDFDIAGDARPVDFLRLRIRFDDGFVAYLNDEEIARVNVDGQPPAFNELATANHEITGGTGEFDEEFDLHLFRNVLKNGRNTLAIEVHNATLDSSDLSLSAELWFSAPGAKFRRGDVDVNDKHSVSDPINILLALFQGEPVGCMEAADVDNDGAVNTADGILLLHYLFLRGQPPKTPLDEAFPDLDSDAQGCAQGL